MRLDAWLVEQRLVESRTKAQALIKEGKVQIGGIACTKPAREITDETVLVESCNDVGRGAVKLRGFLATAGLDLTGKRVLDMGSSTGGFAQVLLEAGAGEVYCVDVGQGQLHPRLHGQVRLRLFESTDIRDFVPPEAVDTVTGDLSFISLTGLLPVIDRFGAADMVLLFKPQYEVGTGVKRSKKGVVQDSKAITAAARAFERAACALGWTQVACKESVITGKEGNVEYFYHFKR